MGGLRYASWYVCPWCRKHVDKDDQQVTTRRTDGRLQRWHSAHHRLWTDREHEKGRVAPSVVEDVQEDPMHDDVPPPPPMPCEVRRGDFDAAVAMILDQAQTITTLTERVAATEAVVAGLRRDVIPELNNRVLEVRKNLSTHAETWRDRVRAIEEAVEHFNPAASIDVPAIARQVQAWLNVSPEDEILAVLHAHPDVLMSETEIVEASERLKGWNAKELEAPFATMTTKQHVHRVGRKLVYTA